MSLMYKRSVFTTITPLPSHITREIVVETLHDHKEMIELNPLVVNHANCKPAPFAPAEEAHYAWYELTDRISYLPGGIIRGNVTYKASFNDQSSGLKTHVYAPTKLDIRDRWSVGGDTGESLELEGVKNLPQGLYLREDVDMRSQIWSTSFVKKTLKRAHAVLVDRLVVKADLLKARQEPPTLGNFQIPDLPTIPECPLPMIPEIRINGIPESKVIEMDSADRPRSC